jgi:meso-butanediol dehydrogenase / (S,S)-butanediol dehydrogenase / diacetyl reductase
MSFPFPLRPPWTAQRRQVSHGHPITGTGRQISTPTPLREDRVSCGEGVHVAELTNKTAVITGGGQGVGLGIALALAEAGANVVICGRTEATLKRACAEIEQTSGRAALGVVGDVLKPADLARLVQVTLERFGTLDILVNNAMIIPHGTILDIDEDTIEAAWKSGPIAALRLMRLCHPHLRDGGVIVNVSSGVAVSPTAPQRGIYAATKAALNSISRAAAIEWGPDGIRVNAIMPFALSDAVQRFVENEPTYAAEVIAAVPLRRIGDPYLDIGQAVAFLAGPGAAYITGVVLPIDGGTSYVR